MSEQAGKGPECVRRRVHDIAMMLEEYPVGSRIQLLPKPC